MNTLYERDGWAIGWIFMEIMKRHDLRDNER